MTKFRIWVCKMLLKQVERNEQQLVYYKDKFNKHFKTLSTVDRLRLARDTGYIESGRERI